MSRGLLRRLERLERGLREAVATAPAGCLATVPAAPPPPLPRPAPAPVPLPPAPLPLPPPMEATP